MTYEWPAMSHGHSSPLVDYWIAVPRGVEPLPTAPRASRPLSRTSSPRRDPDHRAPARLADDTSAVPSPLWLALIFVGCVAVSLQLGMGTERRAT